MSEKLKAIQGYLNQPPIVVEIPPTTALVSAVVMVLFLVWLGVILTRK